jgi:hypothetical protein
MWLEAQRAFQSTVIGADDVIAPHVHASRGPLSNRIAVYRNTVQQSLLDVLATAFPAVQRIVGARFFAALARDFVRAQLPHVPQLSVYGATFADFLASHEQVRELPYLPDVARLEWARGEAYFAVDAPAFDPAALASLAPEQLASLKFNLHPATQLITSDHPIHRIWTVNQPEVLNIPTIEMSIGENVLITRPTFEVMIRLLSPADAAFVEAFGQGQSLADAAAAAMGADGVFDLQAALQNHFIHGTFSGVAVP